MNPTQFTKGRAALGLNIAMLGAASMLVAIYPVPRPLFLFLLFVGAYALVRVLFFLFAGAGEDPLDCVDSQCPPCVDPWEYQRRLMEASDQRMPRRPALTKDALLYGALIMEETSELYGSLRSAILNVPGVLTEKAGLYGISRNFAEMASRNHDMAVWIRSQLVGLTIDVPLSKEDAIALFDDHEDIMVVNCGFGLAAGLPGAPGYEEVGSSNLSKINPTTGKIDKTPDGKWIKGPNYFKPDLARVLAERED